MRTAALLTTLLVAFGLLVPATSAVAQSAPETGDGTPGQSATAPSAKQVATATPKTNLPDVENEVMCTACGTLLALATESPQANRERDLIRGLIAQGLTKDQIKDRLVVEFGPNILATPSTSGFDITAWLVPGLAVLAGAIGIVFGLRRWRRETRERDGSAPTPKALSDEDAKRLEKDLRKYQL